MNIKNGVMFLINLIADSFLAYLLAVFMLIPIVNVLILRAIPLYVENRLKRTALIIGKKRRLGKNESEYIG